jgi:hypothetical protein
MAVSRLIWQRGSAVASWYCEGRRVEKAYRKPIASVCELHGGCGVALVEAIEESGPSNAVVFDDDGGVRFRVDIPLPHYQVQGFADMYYIKDELTAILVTPGRDFAVVIDSQTGKCMRTYETR